ncbi:hypothetical protein BDB01DRAFT_789136, partial [Pilobolus umbonatus]
MIHKESEHHLSSTIEQYMYERETVRPNVPAHASEYVSLLPVTPPIIRDDTSSLASYYIEQNNSLRVINPDSGPNDLHAEQISPHLTQSAASNTEIIYKSPSSSGPSPLKINTKLDTKYPDNQDKITCHAQGLSTICSNNESGTIGYLDTPTTPTTGHLSDIAHARMSATSDDYQIDQLDISNLSPQWESSIHVFDKSSKDTSPILCTQKNNPDLSSLSFTNLHIKPNIKDGITNSKYSLASYFLTNDAEGIKQYQEMALKSDLKTQLMFAKYLMHVASLYYPLNDRNRQGTIGSMWTDSGITKYPSIPKPFYVIPPPDKFNSIKITPAYNSVHTGLNTFVNVETDHEQSPNKSKLLQQDLLQLPTHAIEKQYKTLGNEVAIAKRKALEAAGISMIKLLADQNVCEACYILADWMDQGLHGFMTDIPKSFLLHQIAASENIPESEYAMGQYYEQRGTNPSIMLKHYKSSASSGYVKALYKMAILTLHGNFGLQQDMKKGLNLLFMACAYATENFTEPLHTFGRMLSNDYNLVKFPEEIMELYGGRDTAILYFKRAAELNDDIAQYKLGSIYEHGSLGVSINFAKAKYYYDIAAPRGNAKAMLGLSRIHNKGNHGPGDNNLSDRLTRDESGWLASAPINEEVSFYWCEKAVKKELPDALALL